MAMGSPLAPFSMLPERPAVWEVLAHDILTLAEDASMPDSFWATDSRIRRAREQLNLTGWTRDEVQRWLALG